MKDRKNADELILNNPSEFRKKGIIGPYYNSDNNLNKMKINETQSEFNSNQGEKPTQVRFKEEPGIGGLPNISAPQPQQQPPAQQSQQTTQNISERIKKPNIVIDSKNKISNPNVYETRNSNREPNIPAIKLGSYRMEPRNQEAIYSIADQFANNTVNQPVTVNDPSFENLYTQVNRNNSRVVNNNKADSYQSHQSRQSQGKRYDDQPVYMNTNMN